MMNWRALNRSGERTNSGVQRGKNSGGLRGRVVRHGMIRTWRLRMETAARVGGGTDMGLNRVI